MQRVMTSDLAGHAGEQVALAGWVHHQRHLAQVSFVLVRDARGISQVVIEDDAMRDRGPSADQRERRRDRGAGGRLDAGARPVSSCTPARCGWSARRSSHRRSSMRRPILNAQLPSLLDHAAVSLRHPRIRAGVVDRRRIVERLPLDARRDGVHRDPDTQDRRRGDRERRQRVRPRLLRPNAPTWRRARSCTSR